MDTESLINLIAMIKVISKNLLTWLVLAQTILTAVIASGVLDMWPTVAQYAVVALTGLGSVILFIRRVTPVSQEERGILPKT